MKRITLLISGRVQGVGFRYTTNTIAQSYCVTGTVENLDDGRVKIVVEGELSDIEAFWDAVQHQMHGKIKSFDRFESQATNEFGSFEIKRF